MARRMAKGTARKEIVRLFEMAEKHADEGALARSYVEEARKLAMRHRISLRQYNRRHCRKCCTYWTSGTLRVRTRKDHIVYACLHCRFTRRFRKN